MIHNDQLHVNATIHKHKQLVPRQQRGGAKPLGPPHVIVTCALGVIQ